MPNDKFFIRCPYGEKDDAKELGARWDKEKRLWYIPKEEFPNIKEFRKRWDIVLDCPFKEKDKAKRKGAQWDPERGVWYITKNAQLKDFAQWLVKLPSEKTKPTNIAPAEVASQGLPSPALASSIMPSPLKNEQIEQNNNNGETINNKDTTPKALDTQVPCVTPKDAKRSAADMSAEALTETKVDFTSLPRINGSLTREQLAYELHQRILSSDKPTEWFIQKLGDGSIWTTSPVAEGIDFSSMPTITSKTTKAQLTQEYLERKGTIKGMSGKKKEWFLKELAFGSVCITALKNEDLSQQSSPDGKPSKIRKVIPTK